MKRKQIFLTIITILAILLAAADAESTTTFVLTKIAALALIAVIFREGRNF